MLTKWTSTEDIIISIIKSHTDFSDTINQHDIAAEFMEMRKEHITPRRVRRIIEELIKEGYPVISTPIFPGGYCWGTQEDEVIECVDRLRGKAAKIFIRARRIKKNWLAEKARQVKREQMDLPYRKLERVAV